MNVQIHLYASLAKYLPADAKNKTIHKALPDHSNIGDLIKIMGVPDASIKLIFLNGVHADRSCELQDGDRIGIFPPVGGG